MYSCKLAQNIEIFIHIKKINYLKLPINTQSKFVYKNIFLALKKKNYLLYYLNQIVFNINCITELLVYIINIYT